MLEQRPRRHSSQHQQPHHLQCPLYRLRQCSVCFHLSVFSSLQLTTVIHVYQQILLQALLVVKGHPGYGSRQLQQHQSTLGPRKDGPRMLVSTTLRFFFSLTIDTLPAVENEPMTDHPLPAAVDCPPLPGPGHLMSDEEESQLPDAYSKSSF
jgi:hypothetical protein